ncbi:MAG: hypothetical protein OJF52_003141 [Nitrospira sp.]|jgi:hypothetical protein|nr:MAG: hypothetical protein OJF52_003141 [Nitrospira sp.]
MSAESSARPQNPSERIDLEKLRAQAATGPYFTDAFSILD